MRYTLASLSLNSSKQVWQVARKLFVVQYALFAYHQPVNITFVWSHDANKSFLDSRSLYHNNRYSS